MQIRINGKQINMDKVNTILELIQDKGLNIDRIVVEYNHQILSKEKLAYTFIKDGDNIEIVSFVGGG
ncbi:MAG: sulfur carrier protein ThiS [Candidatus Omnitrophica bacterium]|nr:sulfur carrier protein ThiS [Candidatus Omnitrophota bacterium]